MLCVCSSGGRQLKITPNDLIVVNKIPADIGSEIYLEMVCGCISLRVLINHECPLSANTTQAKKKRLCYIRAIKFVIFFR